MIIIKKEPNNNIMIFHGSDAQIVRRDRPEGHCWAVKLTDRDSQINFDTNGWFWRKMGETLILHSMVAFAECT